MKIELLKDHDLGKAGQVVDETPERGEYLIRMGVAQVPTGEADVYEEPEVIEEVDPFEEPKPKPAPKKVPAKKKAAAKKRK